MSARYVSLVAFTSGVAPPMRPVHSAAVDATGVAVSSCSARVTTGMYAESAALPGMAAHAAVAVVVLAGTTEQTSSSHTAATAPVASPSRSNALNGRTWQSHGESG